MPKAILLAAAWLGITWLLLETLSNWTRLNPFSKLLFRPACHAEFDPRTSWGAYSPFFPARAYAPPPDGCAVAQAHILQRHGARFPTAGAALHIVSAVLKLQSVDPDTYTHPALAFLRTFEYTLGTDDQVPFGAMQSFESGAEAFARYAHLVAADNLPFVRASSGVRVVDSATNWTAGFSAASHHVYNPALAVILSEAGNDTLENHMCPNAGNSDAQTDEWLAAYAPPLAARLNAWAPGAGLTAREAHALISLCAFHSAAAWRAGALALSPVCALFAPADFAAFDYAADLDKYYRTGPGAARGLGRVQGVGFANELLARLTRTPVRDRTQTNRTLDADPRTFPLDRALYADFSHDNTLVAILGALGLFRQRAPLSTTRPDAARTWRTHAMVPFSGRVVVEKLACGADAAEHVRILVNDALQPLEFCGNGTGLCTLAAFVASQSYARSNGAGDWERCFD